MALNQAPVAIDDSVSTLEDAGTVSGNVLDGSSGGLDSDGNGHTLTVTLVKGPEDGVLVGGLAPNGSFTYQPDADFFGTDEFSYRPNDGIEDGNVGLVTITVDSVNDAPTFDLLAQVVVDPLPLEQVVDDVADNLFSGANNEEQDLTVLVTANSNPGLFSDGPLFDYEDLEFTLVPGASGSATLTVVVMDEGGTSNGGQDTSLPQQVTIIVGDSIFSDGFETGDTSGWSASQPGS